jgi:alpha-beta hydrolase superfamily lysophospholipase
MKSRIPLILILAAVGCGMKPLEEQTKKSPNSPIGKETQAITEFDPNAGAKVSTPKIQTTDPISAPVSTLSYALDRTAKLKIEAAVKLFHGEHDRYPKDFDEFMEVIIKPNNVTLPVLPGGKKWQYDVENHELVAVDAPAP